MKKLTHINSIRQLQNTPSFSIVYEWEDQISKELGLKIDLEKKIDGIIQRRFENNGIVNLYQKFNLKNKLGLRFIMTAKPKLICNLNKNTIPIIIDFWLSDSELLSFYKAYDKCPLILVTSAEVYDFLKSRECPLNLEHWPLSIPDEYICGENRKKENYKKDFEFCFLGRQNPFFKRMIKKYENNNPGFSYVINNDDMTNRCYYTNKGNLIAEDKGRSSYIDIIRRSKITCYTTPGMDEAKKETYTFNQVTPRLFEMLAGGCYVLGHYKDNPDTEYYQLNKILIKTDNYYSFSNALDKLRKMPDRNITECYKYLKLHTTSKRIIQLREILKKNNISL